jgi:hypothetical protein
VTPSRGGGSTALSTLLPEPLGPANTLNLGVPAITGW